MKYLKTFENWETWQTSADPEYHKNHQYGNIIVDLLADKDIFLVRKPDSWEEVEEDAVDFEDLPQEALKLLFELPLYKVSDLNQVFDFEKIKNIISDDNNEVLDITRRIYSGELPINVNNFIFYESLKIKEQYFVIQFDMPDYSCGLFVDTQGFDYMRYVLMIKEMPDLYDYYKKDTQLSEYYRYIDGLCALNEELVSYEKIEQIWNRIITKAKNLPDSIKRKVIIYGVSSILALGGINYIQKIANQPTQDVVIKDAVDEALSQFKDPTQMKVSKQGREHIKSHEGIELVAYKLGDGKITVGYGHAEPIHKSKFKNGQRISQEQADLLFKKDLTKAADGVRRIFNEWKSKGIDRKLTQDQFDALVSMAFNMGISALRQTDLIQQIKAGNLEKAGELIKTTKINDDTFPGLRDRREKESEMFMSYLKEKQPDKA